MDIHLSLCSYSPSDLHRVPVPDTSAMWDTPFDGYQPPFFENMNEAKKLGNPEVADPKSASELARRQADRRGKPNTFTVSPHSGYPLVCDHASILI